MSYRNNLTKKALRSYKSFSIITLLLGLVTLMAFSLEPESELKASTPTNPIIKKDSIASVKAFKQVFAVLKSPRCMNCHPSGDIPLQGDDSHLHAMSPKRGLDGKGLYAMKCANCHQSTNTPGLHTPPGNPNWHLPPANMKMVFQGRSMNQLAKQLINPKLNGNKNTQQLIEHADDGLVLAGFNPGEGRKLPPMSHAEFKKAWITWITTGAYAPAK
ncbi:hypothetical protein [Pedobacter nototheniae]|uniref:hypothetical protein n=1 Tax=Pedobacter nototheniae TaxID=2488994 RepID=UPI00292EA7A6|nr:hypothetical protein [Pedobacter nototheniae]